jgi:hypothetical protein
MNHITFSEEEACDIHVALIEYLSDAEEKINENYLDERLKKYSTDFITRIDNIKDKIVNFERATRKKGIPFLGVCK